MMDGTFFYASAPWKRRFAHSPERSGGSGISHSHDPVRPKIQGFYTFPARIVRLELADGSTQMLITNLDPAQFPFSALQKLYAKRWGIETSFRELKYTVDYIYLL